MANLEVAYVVLHPRMLDLIDPHLVRFKTRLKQPIARVAFAQSVTLTPGTITVDLDDDQFTVYALTRSAAESLPGRWSDGSARLSTRYRDGNPIYYLQYGLCASAGLCLVRVIGGPTVLDRILGGNVIGTKVTVLLLIIGVLYGQVEMFVDIAIAYALLNFIHPRCGQVFLHRKKAGLQQND
ncbi:MAG: monovalent cation/H+ antiporter complex subunit F [Syntrophotaleaceae bacterium]